MYQEALLIARPYVKKRFPKTEANAGGKQVINYKVQRMVVRWTAIYIAAHITVN